MIVVAGGVPFDVDAIVFDKDGTLLDLDTTWAAIGRTWVAQCAAGDDELNRELSTVLGLSADGLLVPDGIIATGTLGEIAMATRAVLVDSVTDADERIEGAAMASAQAVHAAPVSPIGEVAGTFERLAAAGFTLCIASSDSADMIHRHAVELGIATWIHSVVGGDAPHPPKPHPAGLLSLSQSTGIAVDRMLMVGDSPTDHGAARHAGAAGIVAVRPPRGVSSIGAVSDAVVSSIDEFETES